MLTATELLAQAANRAEEASWLQLLFTTTASVLLATYLLRASSSARSSNTVPSPDTSLPLLGNTMDIMKHQRHRFYDWVTEQSMAQNGGVWAFTMLGRPRTIVATSPQVFEDVLQTQMPLFPKGEVLQDLIRDFFGRGILAADGTEWITQRKTASHLFSHKMMKTVMDDVVRDKVKLLHDVLQAHSEAPTQTRAQGHDQGPVRASTALSMQRTLMHFTSDVFAKLGFGVELRCLERSLVGDHENAFIEAISHCAHVQRLRFQQPRWLWHVKRFCQVGNEREYAASLQCVNAFMADIIARSIAAKNLAAQATTTTTNAAEASAPQDLIAMFLASPHIAEAAEGVDTELLRDMAISFVFAGKDTTSHSMAWFTVMMNRHPQVARRLREELRKHVPFLFEGGRELTRVPTLEDLSHVPYLEAVIRENLRLNPPVALTSRTATTTTTLSDGTVVYEGDRVALAMYAQARQPSVWGADAAEFKPERWLDDASGALRSVSPFKFSTFFAGPRICLGRKFAMMEMKIALAMVMSRFELTTVENAWDITYELSTTCPVKGPLMVHVRSLAPTEAACLSATRPGSLE